MDDVRQHIDEYLDGDLSPEMVKYFQDKLDEIPALRGEIEFHAEVRDGVEAIGAMEFRKMVAGIDQELDQQGFFSADEEKRIIGEIESIGQDEFRNLLGEVDKELADESFYENKTEQPKAKLFSIQRRLIAIAASIAILVGAFFVNQSISPNNTKLYQDNFAAISDQISSDLLDEKSEIGFAGDAGSIDVLENAMNLYSQNDYASFLEVTEDLLTIDALKHYRDRILLHRGIALMIQGNYDQAQQAFVTSGHPQTDWYRILAYLAQDQADSALQFYETLENPSQRIRDLIGKL